MAVNDTVSSFEPLRKYYELIYPSEAHRKYKSHQRNPELAHKDIIQAAEKLAADNSGLQQPERGQLKYKIAKAANKIIGHWVSYLN